MAISAKASAAMEARMSGEDDCCMTLVSPVNFEGARHQADMRGPYGKRGGFTPAHRHDCAFLAGGVTLGQQLPLLRHIIT
jgi:hypothetical protein